MALGTYIGFRLRRKPHTQTLEMPRADLWRAALVEKFCTDSLTLLHSSFPRMRESSRVRRTGCPVTLAEAGAAR